MDRRTQLIQKVKRELSGNISNQEYECLIQNRVIEEFVDVQLRRGWNYTPGELSGIILSDNTQC